MNGRKIILEAGALDRRRAIGEIVASRPVGSQAELAELLLERGHTVTQATISRDIAELGLVKVTRGDRHVYISTDDLAPRSAARVPTDDRLRRILAEIPVRVGRSGLVLLITGTPGTAGTIAAPVIDATQASGVSMWDITVRSVADPTTPISGRVYTDYLAQITGGNGAADRVESPLWAVTSDGFQYKIDLRGLDPNGFILFGNTVGFLNPDGMTPLYHDVVADVLRRRGPLAHQNALGGNPSLRRLDGQELLRDGVVSLGRGRGLQEVVDHLGLTRVVPGTERDVRGRRVLAVLDQRSRNHAAV